MQKGTPFQLDTVSVRLVKDAPLFSILDRAGVEDYLAGESPWPWYGQLMRKPQTMAWLLQMNHWLDFYRPEILF